MSGFFTLPRLALYAGLFVLLFAMLAACQGGGGSGLPEAAGRYPLKEKSISFDGERYSFYWADAAGQLHRVSTSDVKLQLGDENVLEITPSKEAVLHLKQEEPVTVEGRDQEGDFGSFWYPFLIGSMLSRGGGPVIVNNQPLPPEYRQPQHRFPPTDTFGRGDTIGGSVTTNGRPPDYSRMQPVGGSVAGQTGGTGGGNAVLGRSQQPAVAGGQAGGTGAGSAVLERSGSFRSGSQGYDAKVDSGQIKTINPSTGGSRVGAGSGALGGKPSISTGRSSAPSTSVRPSTGSTPKISTGRRR